MKKNERALHIAQILEQYIPNPQPALTYTDTFSLLVAVCLSAQCTDEKVNQVTPKLFQWAPTLEALSLADPSDVETIIRPCGLSKGKAIRLVSMAKELLERHQGVVPSTFEELEALSGVGHKTASVVMAQAFNQPAFAVDTHILRNARRWGLTQHKEVKKVEADLKKLFPKDKWATIHLQMILFSRLYCPARHPAIDRCPICLWMASTKS
jgi:endonuclease-3